MPQIPAFIQTMMCGKGPEGPLNADGKHQLPPAYIDGREDYLFGRPYCGSSYSTGLERHSYHCGWGDEIIEENLAA